MLFYSWSTQFSLVEPVRLYKTYRRLFLPCIICNPVGFFTCMTRWLLFIYFIIENNLLVLSCGQNPNLKLQKTGVSLIAMIRPACLRR